MFINAAAQFWKLDRHLIRVEEGRVIHPTKAETLAYSDLLSLFRNVLEAARENGNWKAKRRPGHGKGIAACFTFFESYAAIVAEVHVQKKKKLTIKKLTCVIDCGVAVNPNMIHAQIEGRIILHCPLCSKPLLISKMDEW